MEEKLDYTELCALFLEKRLDADEFILLTNWINESYENR